MKIAGLDLSPNSSGVTKFTLDEKFNVIESDYLGFTTVKKNECDKIHHYKNNDFENYIEKTIWMRDKIDVFLDDTDYIAIEDYAFAARGRVFHIAEFAGIQKEMAYEAGRHIRLYDPGSIKIYADGRGNCDKISMSDAYENSTLLYKHDLKHLPEVNKSNGNSPTSDVIDSFFICDLLLLELKLRNGLVDLKTYPQKVIKVFNRTSPSFPDNILSRDFMVKST